jgi:polar amino acid transport system substrate-binding protein
LADAPQWSVHTFIDITMRRFTMSTLAKRFGAIVGAGALVVALAACSAESATGDTVTDGVLTIATGEPAYYPYVLDDAPESGQGFESAVAYAVAEELGFAPEDVVWVRTTFEAAIQPGPKDFDFNLQQYSITEERAANVDFSLPYYSTPQAVITQAGTAASGATSLAELQGLLIGAATGTTSFQAIEEIIQPTAGAQAFNDNDAAKLALETGQIDALVVDLPTAFYLTAVEITDGEIVGQLDGAVGVPDQWGLVLAKDSPLTESVNEAIQSLIDSGKLADITSTWLGADQSAPVLK